MGEDNIQERMQVVTRIIQFSDAPAITTGGIENGEIKLLGAGIQRDE